MLAALRTLACWYIVSRKPTAYPELVKPGEWIIEEWRPDGNGAPCPCTDNAGRRMYVPKGAGKFAKEVRFHELLHVKYSPDGCPRIDGVTMESLLCAEDCRVNLLGTMIRPHDSLGATPMADPFSMVMSKTERGMAQLAAACQGYESSAEWGEEMRDGLRAVARMSALPGWVRRHALTLADAITEVEHAAPYFIHLDSPSFNDAINLAQWLDENFSDKPPMPPQPDPDPENDTYDDKPDEGGDATKAQWGEMKIDTPPLTVRHPGARSKRTRPSSKGAIIRHLNRMVTGEIFGRTRKQHMPDTILIDDSGSMGWDSDKFNELVKQLPVGTIAAYSGHSGQGMLRILAKDGRMVAPDLISTPYGGNEVDGPALRWLATQKGRKVWVSDQGVCSDMCDDNEALMADCQKTIDAAGIKVCLTTDPAEIMRTLRK